MYIFAYIRNIQMVNFISAHPKNAHSPCAYPRDMLGNMGEESDISAFRAQHDRLVWDRVRLTGEKKTKLRRRVYHDARLFQRLEEAGVLEDFLLIEESVRQITAGMGAASSDLSRVRGNSCGDSSRDVRLILYYRAVQEIERRPALKFDALLDVAVIGMRLIEVDKKHRRRTGWALRNIVKCCQIFKAVRLGRLTGG